MMCLIDLIDKIYKYQIGLLCDFSFEKWIENF